MSRAAFWIVFSSFAGLLLSLPAPAADPRIPALAGGIARASGALSTDDCPCDPRPDATLDPLNLVPDRVGVVFKAEKPGRIIDLANQLYALKELQNLGAYREFLESTNFRRFLQIVAYFEKELGKDWQELADRLLGGGVAVAAEFKENPTPVYGVIQGKDEKLTQKFVAQLWAIAEQELARQESKAAARTDKYRGVATHQIGDEFFAASFAATIVFSNTKDGLTSIIDLYLGKGETPPLARNKKIAEAKQLFSGQGDLLAWGWLNLEAARQNQGFAGLLELPAGADVAALHFLFGGFLDVLRRSPYLALGLCLKDNEPLLSIRAPRGSNGRYVGIQAHVPSPGKSNALPLIQLQNTLASGSFYFDFNALWEQRDKLLKGDDLTQFEEFDKKSTEFLFGKKMSQFFGWLGTRHRFVAVRQGETGYQTRPGTRLPSFALVFELRDPDSFMKAAEPALRSLALVGGFAAETKLVEEKVADVKIIGYRFLENEKNQAVQQGILFNFSPCFFRVDEYFVACSTFEVARELVPALQKQRELPPENDSASARVHFSWSGLSDYLQTIEPQLITGQILADGSSPEQAKKEVAALLALLRRLGSVELASEYEKDRFRIDVRIKGLFK